MEKALHKTLRAVLALVAAVAALATGTITAHADSGPGLVTGYYINPISWGTHVVGTRGAGLGVIAMNGGKPTYCIEFGQPFAGFGGWQDADTGDQRIAANLVDRNKGDMSDFTQAAVAWAIHDHIDLNTNNSKAFWDYWKANGSLSGADKNAVGARAAQLWDEAAANMPASARMSYQYTQGKRRGTFDPGLRNQQGGYISGIPYTIVDLNNKAKFDATGTNSISGVTKGGPEHIPWTAIGNGMTNFKMRYYKTRGAISNAPGQKVFYARDPELVDSYISFEVRRDFQPTVTTQVSSKELKRGQTVADRVTSGVNADAGDEWVQDPLIRVTAKGYYFQGRSGILASLPQNGDIKHPENPAAYLNRVKAKYGNPVATASTAFTNSGQTNTVTAKKADGTDYVNPEDGLFGVWVWMITKSEQPAGEQDYITNDFIDSYGQARESDVHQIQASIWSEVAEPHAQEHSDVRDVIHVKGLPKDLGYYKASDGYGFTADQTKAEVEVWWSGASGGDAGVPEEDMKFMPSTAATPTQDANHKLVRTVTYDLADLIKAEGPNYKDSLDIKVAGGSAGSPLADGSHFSISAENTGYYTFVFKYAGCSRVRAYTSAYNDQFESTFVTKPKITVSLSSNTNPDSVLVGEEFWDTATISGDKNVTQGAYITFDAYNPVLGKPDTGAGKLLDNDRKVLTADQLQRIHSGYQVEVQSTHIKAQDSGTVYWQAALHAANGTILATHSLGVKSESTVIKAGGEISSVSQTQGAVGGPAWDIITVADRTTGANRGNIPAGATVTVDLYKHEGQNQVTNGQKVATRTYPVNIAKLGQRPGKYSFKAELGKYPAAGQYNWVARLIASDGSVIAEGSYGEDTERTSVQEYGTAAAKKWLSNDGSDYADQTIRTYDVLLQKSYAHWGTDMQSHAFEGQTMPGTKATFSIRRQEATTAADTTILTGSPVTLPRVPDASRKTVQKVKSQTFTLPSSATAGTYYYGLRITNDVDAAHLKDMLGEQSDGLVYQAPDRVKSESFDVVKVSSKSAEPVWVNTQKHVSDTLLVEGNLPSGSAYEVEIWQRDAAGKAVKRVSTTGRKTIDHAITGKGEIKTILDTPKTPAGYQFRHRIWTPDNQGGEPRIGEASQVVDDNWTPSPGRTAGYADRHLLYEGDNVPAERFELIAISTDVAGTTNMHTASNGEHYVDTTDGVDINDHAAITGHLPAGYRIGFELYRQDDGDDPSKDSLVDTIPATNLDEATKAMDSATRNLTGYGDYYWVYVFSKQSGDKWQPDGESQIRDARRVKGESFHAVRVTTMTHQWTSKDGKATDTALIEGRLPGDATIAFDLHDYETQAKAGALPPVRLTSLGYKAGPERSLPPMAQRVTSNELTIPGSIDYYWVETIRLPGESIDFHRGKDRVPGESTRSIDATTQATPQISLGTAISDTTDLANIKYSKDGDIRDDLKASLKASWEMWKQDTTREDTSADKLIDTIDKDGVPLADGQSSVESGKATPRQVGMYYWRIRITDTEGRLIKYGAPRDPAETFRVVSVSSQTMRLVSDGTPIKDQVTINGPVAAGTMVSWKAYRQNPGDTSKDTQVLDWYDPAHGAALVDGAQARAALTSGKTTIETPLKYSDAKPGDTIYWVFTITSPRRGPDGRLRQPAKDRQGRYTTDHLAQTCRATLADTMPGLSSASATDPASCRLQPTMTDKARTESETVDTVKVTTRTEPKATVGDMIHDTALIEGTIPNDDYSIIFEYWSQDPGADPAKDRLVSTSAPVPVKAGATQVQGPGQKAVNVGRHYYRERLVVSSRPGDVVHYGAPRVPGESVVVSAVLAKTGAVLSPVVAAVLLLVFGVVPCLAGRRRV